jgi:HAD superfamily hydrolase (TIGR01490 family)
VRRELEAEKAKEKSGGVAAFFDLDGTLVELPSMERRFFGRLRWCGRVRARNYFLWMAEALRLAPRGVEAMLHANKMYLTGLRSFPELGGRELKVNPDASMRLPVPEFFSRGIERVEWHARQGHAIFLVSGTLDPLARGAAMALAVRLALRGAEAKVGVCATRLQEIDGKWTGKIVGEAIFGEAKARAVNRIAAEAGFELRRCYAYGDSSNDRWMLAAVGRATAVNPSNELERIAGLHAWPVMRWSEKKAKRIGAESAEKEGTPPRGNSNDWGVKRLKQVHGENLESSE